MSTAKPDNLIGKELGDYIIKRLIAKGGMGRVYEAEDLQLGRRVAIKIITLNEDAAEDLIHRFEREARVISQLDAHPNIVTIYRYGREDGVTYFAMQYVSGDSLASYMKSLRDLNSLMDYEELIHILRQVGAALDHAHSQGVIHRDVKPANIMLEHDPSQRPIPKRAILMDFGLVMSIDNTVTAGTAFGTPRYISPEQAISSAQACPQSDVYSLGVVTYEMLTGQPPFEDDDTPISVALSHVTKDPPSPKVFRPDLPPAAEAVIMRVLEKKPQDRYQTAAEFVNALEASLLAVTPRPGIVLPKNAPILQPRPKPPNPSKAVQSEPHTMMGEVRTPIREERGRDHILPSLVLMVVFIAIAVIIYVIFFQNQNSSSDNPTEVAAESQLTNSPQAATEEVAQVTEVVTGVVTEEATEEAIEQSTTVPTQQATQVPTTQPSATHTATLTRTPTAEPSDTPTTASEVTVIPIVGAGTIELLYENDYIIIRNNSQLPIQMLNVELKNGDKIFTPTDLGRSRLENWLPGTCAFIALRGVEFNTAISCRGERLDLLYASKPTFFVWSGNDGTFEVYQDGVALGSCQIAEGRCVINGIRES